MGHDSTLNCDPGSEFHVELWPRVRIPRWIVTPGHDSTLNCDPGSCFHVELWPRVIIPRWIVTPGHDSTLNFDPGSEFHVELWPRVMIPHWIMAPGPNFTLNCYPRSGSHFNVKFWSRVTIQRGILTRGHNSTWNSDPSTYLQPVELRLNKVSKFNGAIKIQQLGRVIIQRKIHWIVTPGRYSMGGGQNFILHRTRNLMFLLLEMESDEQVTKCYKTIQFRPIWFGVKCISLLTLSRINQTPVPTIWSN